MEELFLLKYAIFALSFVNKLDSKLDRKFYAFFSLEFQSTWNTYVYMLESIHHNSQSNEDFIDMMFPAERFNNNNVYDKFLDSLFVTYLADNSCLVMETNRFYLPPMNRGIDMVKVISTKHEKSYFVFTD